MAKEFFTSKMKCFSATKNQNGAQVGLAIDVQKNEQGQQTAREAIILNLKDQSLVDKFTVGKTYTITINE